ncbi:MAG: arginase family protein [Kofleriaceae bacterium]
MGAPLPTTASEARAELSAMLRPAGGGLYTVSTGVNVQRELQSLLYGANDDAAVFARFLGAIDKVADARVVMLGVPSDVGAGYRRGANLGPQAIRSALHATERDYRGWLDRHKIVDVGDVFVVPQLLHDDMLSDRQIEATRATIYPYTPPGVAERLPVSPLSIEERVLHCLFVLNPKIKPFILGGDHSVAWPVAASLRDHRDDRWGIVQPDAHTDMLPQRLGVKYCYATWSYHANQLLHRDGRLVQVGVRSSRHDREHWETLHGVRQLWAKDIEADPDAALEVVMAHLKKKQVTSVYLSNDIDGTDPQFAEATGTPEPGGLSPDWVLALISRIGKEIGLCAADCVEVAPPLASTALGGERTVATAVRYVRACLDELVR